MERQRTSSLFISGFVLITVLYFIPTCPAGRLLYSPLQNSPVGEDHEHDQSKSAAQKSVSDHSGSANGDAPPSVPPPPLFETPYGRGRNVSQSPPATAVGQNNVSELQDTAPPPPTSSYSGTCAYERHDSYGNRYIIITRCNISYHPPPPPEYEGNGDYP